jgi:hypothetical protein
MRHSPLRDFALTSHTLKVHNIVLHLNSETHVAGLSWPISTVTPLYLTTNTQSWKVTRFADRLYAANEWLMNQVINCCYILNHTYKCVGHSTDFTFNRYGLLHISRHWTSI